LHRFWVGCIPVKNSIKYLPHRPAFLFLDPQTLDSPATAAIVLPSMASVTPLLHLLRAGCLSPTSSRRWGPSRRLPTSCVLAAGLPHAASGPCAAPNLLRNASGHPLQITLSHLRWSRTRWMLRRKPHGSRPMR
jgi:hypothetical protein